MFRISALFVCSRNQWRSLTTSNLSRVGEILPDCKYKRQSDDALNENDPKRLMIADILVQRGQDRWVLDAKYKRDFGNESRTDRFQMCAYAIGFHANRATLVY